MAMAPRLSLIAFALFWGAAAIHPVDRFTWALENVLLVPAFIAFAASCRRVHWSGASTAAVLAFLALHVVGAHYTYSLVPWDGWVRTLTGVSVDRLLGLERNYFDRFVHFAWGALLAVPAFELGIRRWRATFTAVQVLMLVATTAMLYELVEWGAAVVFGDASASFLGSQGDVWDAHWDMLLALVGAGLTLATVGLRRGRRSPSNPVPVG